jgi:hypothetical protein
MQSTVLIVLVGLMNREGGTESAQALLEACNASLVYGRCEPRGSTVVPEAVQAQVTWLEGDLGADIQVFLGEPPLRRSLHFKQEDPLVERWRAVGLIIATLTEVRRSELETELEAELAQPLPLPPLPPLVLPPAPVPTVPSPAPAASATWARWWELGAAASPGMGGARGQLGGWAGLRQQLGARPVLGVLEASWATGLARPDGVKIHAVSVAVGVGAFLARNGWQPRVRAELLGERRSASIVDDTTGQKDSGARAVVGGRVGADFLSPSWSRVSLLLGADATVSARTAILVHNEPAGSLPAFRVALRAGVTLGP